MRERITLTDDQIEEELAGFKARWASLPGSVPPWPFDDGLVRAHLRGDAVYVAPASETDAAGRPKGTVWTAGRIARLRPLLAQCPYASGPFRGCGCRGCWWRGGRDVALRDCLECMAPLVPEVTAPSPAPP